MGVFLGVDEGQTGTRAILLDQYGFCQSFAVGPPGNIRRHSEDLVVLRWRSVIDEVMLSAGVRDDELTRAGFGLSSLVWTSDRPRMESVIERLQLPCPRIVIDDCMMALRAGVPSSLGLALIAGSGSGVIGRNREGTIFRTFNSSRFGDGGGSWSLTGRVMEHIALFYLGRAPETSLTEKFLKLRCLREIPALIEDYDRNTIQFQVPDFIESIFDASEYGDTVARDLLRDLAARYVNNIGAVAEKLGFHDYQFDLALSGGLFRAGHGTLLRLVETFVSERLGHPSVKPLSAAPAVGAALAAMDMNSFTLPEAVRTCAIIPQ